jgi:hypothetical protein
MTSRRPLVRGWIVLAVFVPMSEMSGMSGCLDLQTSSSGTANGGGPANGSSSGDASGSNSSGEGTGGYGGGNTSASSGQGGASFTSSASSSSSSGSSPQVVLCNTGNGTFCDTGRVCCHGSATTGFDSCAELGMCPVDTIAIACDGPADCPGQICCGTRMKGQYLGVSCQDTCTGLNYVVFCTGDSASSCPMGLSCVMDPLLGMNYFSCQL